MTDRTKWPFKGSVKGGSPLPPGGGHDNHDDHGDHGDHVDHGDDNDDAPLLSRAFDGGDGLRAGEFQLLHAKCDYVIM